MLNWLRRRIAARERRTFQFWDGHTLRAVDPLPVLRSLRSHPEFNWQQDPELADNGDEAAFERCVAAARDIFEIPTWDGRVGLTEDQTWAVLVAFAVYLGEQKKSGSTPPSTPQPTEPPHSETSDTRGGSGSTSTSTETSSEKPPNS